MKKCIVVGAGFAGSIVARELAEAGFIVEVLEQRSHIGGNAYDFIDENGILVHKYGPHVFFTDDIKIVEYINRFSDWKPVDVFASVMLDEKYISFPFSFNSIEGLYSKEKASFLIKRLVNAYGFGNKIPILDLIKSDEADIRELANLLYEKDFLPYTTKQWGIPPHEIDASVTARVPIRINYENRFSTKKYQLLPQAGYTQFFESLFNHPHIRLHLGFDALDKINIIDGSIAVDGKIADFPVIYTGSVDTLFSNCFGELPYRALKFESKTAKSSDLPTFCVYYPNANLPYTRGSDYSHIIPNNIHAGVSTVIFEHSCEYDKKQTDLMPMYPFSTDKANEIYCKYKNISSSISNLFLVGRLAEYKYFNMEQVVERALALGKHIAVSKGFR